MKGFRLAICILCLAFCCLAVGGQTTVGYVLEVNGDWVLNGSNRLSQGEKLPAAGSIRLTTSPRNSRIVIADLRGELLTSRNCAVDNCSAAIRLPNRKPASTWNAVFDTAMELIWGAPDKYSAHRSRSGELSDGVLKIVGGKVDFTPLLTGQGEQYLRWQGVSTGPSGDALGSRPIPVPSPAVLHAPQLVPGLYAFDLVRRMGDNFETVSSARILLTDEATHEKTQGAFQKAVALTEKWGAKVRPETTRLYLQTTLVELSHDVVR